MENKRQSNSYKSERKDASRADAAFLQSDSSLLSPAEAFFQAGVSSEKAFGPDAILPTEQPVLKAVPTLLSETHVTQPQVYRSVEATRSFVTQTHTLDRFDQPLLSTKKGLVDSLVYSPVPTHSSNDEVEPPSPKGGYLEPYHHVFTKPPPRDVYDAVSDVLRIMHVDIEPRPNKFKLVCAYYPDSGKISFKVRIYRVKSDSEPGVRYCLEFQRRSGDCVRFSEMYWNAMHALNARGVINVVVPPLRSTPAEFDLDLSKLGDTLKFLVQMASSEYCDIKSEGVKSLCDLSCDQPAQPVLIAEGVFDIFLENCGHEMEDVNRCSITGLANLSKSRPVQCRALVSHGCIRNLITTLTTKPCPTPQIVRETARLLVNVSEQVGREIIADAEEAQTAFNQLLSSPDPIVRQHADQLQFHVGGVTY